MQDAIPLVKQSKRKRKEHFASKRGDWGLVNPVTKVIPSKKRYDRKKTRRELCKSELREE